MHRIVIFTSIIFLALTGAIGTRALLIAQAPQPCACGATPCPCPDSGSLSCGGSTSDCATEGCGGTGCACGTYCPNAGMPCGGAETCPNSGCFSEGCGCPETYCASSEEDRNFSCEIRTVVCWSDGCRADSCLIDNCPEYCANYQGTQYPCGGTAADCLCRGGDTCTNCIKHCSLATADTRPCGGDLPCATAYGLGCYAGGDCDCGRICLRGEKPCRRAINCAGHLGCAALLFSNPNCDCGLYCSAAGRPCTSYCRGPCMPPYGEYGCTLYLYNTVCSGTGTFECGFGGCDGAGDESCISGTLLVRCGCTAAAYHTCRCSPPGCNCPDAPIGH